MSFKKYKYSVLLGTAILFLCLTLPVFALEINYPDFGVGTGTSFSLAEYVRYFFWFLIVSSGTIGIISIVISGLKILLAFGSPEKLGQAWGNIYSIVLGIVLLLTSFIILNTINYELVGPGSTVLPTGTGIYIRYDTPNGIAYRTAPQVIKDIQSFGLSNPHLEYRCQNAAADMLVWGYSLPNNTIDFTNFNFQDTVSLSCGSSIPLSGYRSYVINPKVPGVYFFRTADCSGYSSQAHKTSGSISYPFAKKYGIRSMYIINGITEDEKYGVILNRSFDGTGECSEPIFRKDSGEYCIMAPEFPKAYTVSSTGSNLATDFLPNHVYVLKYDSKAYLAVSVSTGADNYGSVDLKSDNLIARFKQGGSTGTNSSLTANYNIGPMLVYKKDDVQQGAPEYASLDKLIRDAFYTKVNGGQPYRGGSPREGECCTDDSEDIEGCCLKKDESNPPQCIEKKEDPYGSCLNKVEINGSYYVALYSRDNTGKKTCRVFTGRSNPISHLLQGGYQFYKLSIIPRFSN